MKLSLKSSSTTIEIIISIVVVISIVVATWHIYAPTFHVNNAVMHKGSLHTRYFCEYENNFVVTNYEIILIFSDMLYAR